MASSPARLHPLPALRAHDDGRPHALRLIAALDIDLAFRTDKLDLIDGLRHAIDVAQPARGVAHRARHPGIRVVQDHGVGSVIHEGSP